MSDRFKFRAWHKELKAMREVFGFDVNHVTLWNRDGEEYILPPDHDEVILMQCTGIPARKSYRGDKPEDLLIFESDIVECDSWERNRFYVFYSEHFQRLHLMPLTDGRLKKEYGRLGVHIFDWIYPEVSLEIIGNIHDNPELLEGGKPK